jgi:hypothetical protein
MGNTIIAASVSTAAQLNAAIVKADSEAAGSGAYEIDLANFSTITLNVALDAINLKSGVTLVIDGEDDTLNGEGRQRGLFVYSGAVTIEDLTIENADALGGSGAGGGGGGAGLGGGLFVASAGNVTLDNVDFSKNSATGGNGSVGGSGSGSYGGGGGLGGGGGGGYGGGRGGRGGGPPGGGDQ